MCEYCEKSKAVLCYALMDSYNSSICNIANRIIVPDWMWLYSTELTKLCDIDYEFEPLKLPLIKRIKRFFTKRCPQCGRKLKEADDGND